jgi:DNA-binding SARP family transcriptional activator/TolB-like protein
VLRLRTLGGLYVATETGEPIGGAATQRRTLALLAALAVAGDRGLSRDRLVALLWPEADEERGRHSLTQALYAARRALDMDDLFVGGGDVRLRRDRCGSDVQELEEALDAQDFERAAALYAGPFADGFYLTGSGEFEQWTTAQRARLEDRMADALGRLAAEAETEGRSRDALGWRKRLAAVRPLDASVTVALMRTLAEAGDRAGAIRHAQLHQTLLREQLGLDPDPVVTSLAARLRQPMEWSAAAQDQSPDDAGAELEPSAVAVDDGGAGAVKVREPGGSALPAEAMTSSRAAVPGVHSAGSRSPRRWRLVAGASVALAAGLVAGAALLARRGADREAVPPPTPKLEQQVVVAPFRVSGASASLAYLREGMVELLSTRLADDSSDRSVDAGAVLGAWRAAGLGGTSELPRSTIARLAATLGAERVVIGSVVGSQRRLVLTANVTDAATGRPLGQASVEGAADSITSLVDRLAVRLLLLDAGEEASLATRTSESLPALRAFLDGQAAFRRANYTEALRRYGDAVRLDSTFALAAVQLARSADRLRLVEPRGRALALAWRERDALDARARALLVAMAGPAYPEPSKADEQVDAWERLVDLTPDRAEAWYELGTHLIDEGLVVASPRAAEQGVTALQRAVQLDFTHLPARELLARERRDQSDDGTTGSGVRETASDFPLAPFLQWRAAMQRGDRRALRRLRDTLPQLGPRNLRAIASLAQLEAKAMDDARLAVEQLRARAVRTDDRVDAALAEHALARNQGRLRAAAAVTERLRQLGPAAQTHLRLRILDALYGDGDARVAAEAANDLRRSVGLRDVADPAARAVQIANACVLGQWALSQEDTVGVRELLDRLRQAPLSTVWLAPPVAAGPQACAELLDAALAVAQADPRAADAVVRLDSVGFTVGSSGDAIAWAPILIARLHERIGQPEAALQAVRRREDAVGWPRYLATAWRDEARYAAATGRAEDARRAFGRYLALRQAADSALGGSIDAVRRDSAAVGRVPR